MSIRFDDVTDLIGEVSADDLTIWIERGWVLPEGPSSEPVFTTTDVARIRLIVECRSELEIDDQAMPVVLSLLDQVYGLRRELVTLTKAINQQPDHTRTEIFQSAKTPVSGDDDQSA